MSRLGKIDGLMKKLRTDAKVNIYFIIIRKV